MEISNPEEYVRLRDLVPTDGIPDDIVNLYPNVVIPRMREKQRNAMKGAHLPPTIGIYRVMNTLPDQDRLRELTLIAHETITTNLE